MPKKGVSPDRTEHWKSEPDEHDYPAATDYLSLVTDRKTAEDLVAELKKDPIYHRKAKDLLRASNLDLLGENNVHVAADLKKVRNGERLSPVLLVRGDLVTGAAMTIADGYHRICASYHLDEDADIPCRIADKPTDRSG
jgi:hypothetical protein